MSALIRVTARLRNRLAERGVHGDAGTSLTELLVGMGIFVIFMAMFTGAVVSITQDTNKAEAVNQSSSQLNVAFLQLDKTVRYAAAISAPGKSTTSGDWYVEMRSTYTGTEVCTQLRVDITAAALQRRTWTVINSVASTPSAWVPITSGISNGAVASGSTDQPFTLRTATATAKFQQLAITLVSPFGNGSGATTSRSSYLFSAVNSTVPPPTTPICQQPGRP